MINVRTLLLVAFASVFSLVIGTNPDTSAIEKPGSDPTRPSESIETEEDTIQIDELGGNQSNQTNTPAGGKPDIETHEQDLFSDKIKVKFNELITYRSFEANEDCKNRESDPCTDSIFDHSEWNLVAYVQGKRIDLFTPARPVGDRIGGFHNGIGEEITVSMPKTAPLSIIIVGYEEDACPHYEFPSQIEDSVNEALSIPAFASTILGKYPKLKTIEYNLISHVNDGCVQLQNRHDIFPGINKVYEPLSGGIHYGEGTHVESGQWPQQNYAPLVMYKLEYTISPIFSSGPQIDDSSR